MALFIRNAWFSCLVFGLLVTLSTSVQALEWPPTPTDKSFRCTYEGIFPQSTVRGTWEYVGDEQSIAEYGIHLSDNAMITPLVRTRVADAGAEIQTLKMTQKTSVVGDSLRERTTVEGTIEGPTIGSVTLKITSINEQVCSASAKLSVGDRWTCTHATTDGWTVLDAHRIIDSGEDKQRAEVVYQYLRDEPVTLSVITDPTSRPQKKEEQTIQSAVVEETTTSGLTQRVYLDPDFVWCPLLVERIRWKQVVGSDRLIARYIGQTIPTEPTEVVEKADGSEKTTSAPISRGWLYVLLLLLVVFWVVQRIRRS